MFSNDFSPKLHRTMPKLSSAMTVLLMDLQVVLKYLQNRVVRKRTVQAPGRSMSAFFRGGRGGGGSYAVKRILTGCTIKWNDILITIDQI